jgi:tol-pal system protein YbgF
VKLRRFSWLAPLAATLTAGCFATRNDVRLLKADIERMHNESETARKAEADRVRAEQTRRDSLAVATNRRLDLAMNTFLDSLRALGDDVNRLRATQTLANNELQLQIETIQQMVGVTQKQIRDANLRAEALRESSSMSARGDSGATEGPRTLYQVGVDQLIKGAYVQARGAFQEMIDKFPKDTLVGDALYQIGVVFATEKQDAKADSVWASVVRLHPKSDKAPLALFKLAGSAAGGGRTEEARRLYTQLIKDYPGTDEARLATTRLAQLPKR